MAVREIHAIKRLQNSVNGNPRLEVRFVGELGPHRTMRDSQAGLNAASTLAANPPDAQGVKVDVQFGDGEIIGWEEVR
jgi:hypothetical protein